MQHRRMYRESLKTKRFGMIEYCAHRHSMSLSHILRHDRPMTGDKNMGYTALPVDDAPPAYDEQLASTSAFRRVAQQPVRMSLFETRARVT